MKFLILALILISIQSQAQKVIDAHVHLDFENKQIDFSPEDSAFGTQAAFKIKESRAEFEADAKAAGLSGFVAHTNSIHSKTPAFSNPVPTYCVGVHEKFNLNLIKAGIQSKKYKCIKIYLGYTYKYAYDPSYSPLYALAAEFNVPVVFHTGDTSTTRAKLKYAHPLTIDEVAVDHPHTIFVIAHSGNPWIQDAAEVAYKNPNVYLDASGILIGDITRFSDEELTKYLIEPIHWVFGYVNNTKKMMFGTDWPLVNIKSYLDALKRAIPAANQQDFFHDNAARVFHISD